MSPFYVTPRPTAPPKPIRTPRIERCRCDATYERTEHVSPVYAIWAAVHDQHEEDVQ